jgi:phage shock protein PspC (stress-responsive transcriptional regulator)
MSLKRLLALLAALYGAIMITMYFFLWFQIGQEQMRDNAWLVPAAGGLLIALAIVLWINPKEKSQ